jgi:hypothetical protein
MQSVSQKLFRRRGECAHTDGKHVSSPQRRNINFSVRSCYTFTTTAVDGAGNAEFARSGRGSVFSSARQVFSRSLCRFCCCRIFVCWKRAEPPGPHVITFRASLSRLFYGNGARSCASRHNNTHWICHLPQCEVDYVCNLGLPTNRM